MTELFDFPRIPKQDMVTCKRSSCFEVKLMETYNPTWVWHQLPSSPALIPHYVKCLDFWLARQNFSILPYEKYEFAKWSAESCIAIPGLLSYRRVHGDLVSRWTTKHLHDREKSSGSTYVSDGMTSTSLRMPRTRQKIQDALGLFSEGTRESIKNKQVVFCQVYILADDAADFWRNNCPRRKLFNAAIENKDRKILLLFDVTITRRVTNALMSKI
ncbi:hypothetical protein BJ912DRAFT_1109637 [Pholiota molesta]|nr:hypothetical protein BJ912DRAFT_1109637 [Pholiota molesta]